MKSGEQFIHPTHGLVTIVDGQEIEPGVVLVRLANGVEPGVSVSMLKPVPVNANSDGTNSGAAGGA